MIRSFFLLFFGVTAPPASAGAPFAPAVTGLSVVAMMRSSRCVLVVVGLVGWSGRSG